MKRAWPWITNGFLFGCALMIAFTLGHGPLALHPAPLPPRHEGIMLITVDDEQGEQKGFPVVIMHDPNHVILSQPNLDYGPRHQDRIVMNRAFARRVHKALGEALK